MKQRILVVEDQPDSRRIMRDLLGSAGFEVLEATSGGEGVRMAAQERPDLILMDLQLPVIDGLEATRRIKAKAALRAIPIIAVTAHAMRGDREKALANGCDDYLSKPIDEDVLFAKLRKFLGDPAAV